MKALRLSKRELELLLERVPWPKNLNVKLEQYPTPASVAADVLWRAFLMGDIEGKTVADLGCGTGRLAYGVELLGGKAVCVEYDERLLKLSPCSARVRAYVPFVPLRRVDTVIMNPPFGTKRKKADRPFLLSAFELASVVYSIQPDAEGLRRVVRSLAEERGFECEILARYNMHLPQLYEFHASRRKKTRVALYRCAKGMRKPSQSDG